MRLAVLGIAVEDLLPEEPPVDPSRVTPGFLGFAATFVIIGVLALVVTLVIVAIVVFVQRSSSKPAQAPPPMSPGWYPVPDGSGRMGWWDGEKWTDQGPPHTSS